MAKLGAHAKPAVVHVATQEKPLKFNIISFSKNGKRERFPSF